METTAPATVSSKTTPKDFFLWAGALIALYGSITSFIALLFEYINAAFPDPLAYYGDPYSGATRFSMAALIVLVPTTIVLLRIIRGTIQKDEGKANIWVRRWALVLTIFIAVITVLIDLITLINTFLGGEISERFILKVAVVLLVAVGVFLHFLADIKGYWIGNAGKANSVGIGVAILALVAIISGFFIIGTPGTVRELRYDAERVSDLQNVQWQLVSYWQQKQELPETLDELVDPLSGWSMPLDPETGSGYSYEKTGATSFTLCAKFNQPTPDTKGQGSYPARDIAVSYPGGAGIDENWQHGASETCFERTIDPDRYPPFEKPLR
ncbi:MAG TPA: DUF5671 domain-containing protein [Candidatus Paceibacterota bacterium]|nr:DUF5671 domain-containing protein [Candidatus Paceibacterota bacterium]